MKLYDTSKPEDLATLAPGHYYWCDSSRGYRCPEIVFVYMTDKGRAVTDGNEYTWWHLRERVEQCVEYGNPCPKFIGPIEVPKEFA